MVPKLGVNIDHVATLRQARGEQYPSIGLAAEASLKGGADQITVHLREDRRHIQDADIPIIRQITQEHQKCFNFEMGCHPEIIQMGLEIQPEWVCLVPEKREEQTTEGGLNLLDKATFKKVEEATKKLQSSNIKVSLFVEANLDVMQASIEMGANAVEIHTGEYAIDFNKKLDIQKHLDQYEAAYHLIKPSELLFHAGHGLTLESVKPLLEQRLFAEYNIGHWIICDSVFFGLENVVRNMKKVFNDYPIAGL